jgi:hypothetical protein
MLDHFISAASIASRRAPVPVVEFEREEFRAAARRTWGTTSASWAAW